MNNKTAKIRLANGEYTVVDKDREDWVNMIRWFLTDGCYVGTKIGNKKMLLLHRFLMGDPTNKQIDHINGNGLDNRLCNLRICNPQQNQANAKTHKDNISGYRGITKDISSKIKPWKSIINLYGKPKYFGRYQNPETAALVRDLWAIHYFKEFARTNFIIDKSLIQLLLKFKLTDEYKKSIKLLI